MGNGTEGPATGKKSTRGFTVEKITRSSRPRPTQNPEKKNRGRNRKKG